MINRSRIKPWGFALATATFMFASQQAMALSVSANGGDESFGVEASQTIFPTLRAGVGYLNTGRITRRLSGVVQRTGGRSFRMLRWQDRLPSPELPIKIDDQGSGDDVYEDF